MEPVLHAIGFIVTSAIIALVFIFVFADLAARLEFIQQKLPWLQRWLEKRSSVVYLLVVAIFLQVFFVSELKDKELPSVPIFSPVFATIPAPIIREEEQYANQGVNKIPMSPVVQREPSLRDRANKLANELQAFTDQRDKHMPEIHESVPITSEQRQAIENPWRTYQQETYQLYDKRFSVRVVTVVAEFKARGIDVSPIENCAASGVCAPTAIPVELHALAARLDDNDDVRR
jgi:hypothetical protein